MKKRINLITKQKKYKSVEKFFGNLRYGTFISVGLFAVISLGIFILLTAQKNDVTKLNNEKQELYSYVTANKEAEAKYVYFRNKQKQISDILKDDVNFYPYYQVLQSSLGESSSEAVLDALELDKSRVTKFTISFASYDILISYFKLFESQDFLKNFDELSVVKFNPIELSKDRYQLNFTGKFKHL